MPADTVTRRGRIRLCHGIVLPGCLEWRQSLDASLPGYSDRSLLPVDTAAQPGCIRACHGIVLAGCLEWRQNLDASILVYSDRSLLPVDTAARPPHSYPSLDTVPPDCSDYRRIREMLPPFDGLSQEPV